MIHEWNNRWNLYDTSHASHLKLQGLESNNLKSETEVVSSILGTVKVRLVKVSVVYVP